MTLTKSLVRLFSHVSRRRRWQLSGLLVLMLAGVVAEMATLGAVVPFLALLADPDVADKYPVLQKVFGWFGGTSGNMLLSAAILFGFIAVGAGLVRMLLMWVSLRISYGLGADIGCEVYRHTLYQPYSWHVSRNSSEILAGIDKVNIVVYGVITQLAQGCVSFALSIGILITLFAIDSQTAFIAGTGFSILYGVTTLTLNGQLLRNGDIISKNVNSRVQAVQEGLGGIRDVLLDGTQPIYIRRFAVFDYAMRRAQAANAFFGASPRYVIEAGGMVMIVALAYWLAGHQGGLGVALPVLGTLAIGAQKLLPQMQIVYLAWASISGNRSQLEDVLELLDHAVPMEHAFTAFGLLKGPTVKVEINEPELVLSSYTNSNENCLRTQNSHPAELENLKHPWQSSLSKPLISLRNVSFRYRPDAAEVLTNISLDIPRGACVGVIGKTGSGKSTLIDLILGLLDATAGQIEIEGQPLNALNRRQWQLRIAHVPQSIYLSDASIAENIAFGVSVDEVDMSRVKVAAARAKLADFIETLPQQYQTSVGERGVRLSGGQRQRIGLARAFYKRVEVLILDEATSALDDATEREIMRELNKLSYETTILMIAHRLSTLSRCDAILTLQANRKPRWQSYDQIVTMKTTQPPCSN